MIHIFDVDHTVISKASAVCFINLALKEKIIRFSQISRLPLDWIKYKLSRPDMDFIENTVKKLSGIKKEELDRVSQICFEKYLKPNIYKGAALLIREAQNRGEKVIFATSTFDFIIKPLEKYFNIQESIACEMEYLNGITTGKLVGISCFGHKKKIAAEAWMNRNNVKTQDVIFYSDSYIDIPLLEYCGNPVAVNPDGTLAGKAKKHGWKILLFKGVLGTTAAS